MFKNLSIFQIAILAFFLIVAAGGLIAFITYQAGQSGTSSIIIWSDVDAPELWSYLEEERPDWVGQVEVIEYDSDTFIDSLYRNLSSQSIQTPDLIITDSANQYALGDRTQLLSFETLPIAQFQEVYISGAFDLHYRDQGFTAIPLFVDPLILYSNQRLLNSFGIAQPPQYWDQVSNITNQYAKRRGAAIDQVIIPLGLADNVVEAESIFSAMLGQVGVKPIGYESGRLRANATGPESVQVLTYYTDFANTNSGVYNWNANFTNSRDTFVAEESLFYFDLASRSNEVQQLNPNMAIEYSELPQIRDSIKYTDAKIISAFMPAQSSDIAKSITYLNEISTDENVIELANDVGLSSAKRNQVDTNRQDQLQRVANRSALYAGSWLRLDPAETKAFFADLIVNVLYRGEGVSTSLSNYTQDLQGLIN